MKYYLLLILLFQLVPDYDYGQIFRNTNSYDDEHFLFEVKQIDEFIERFNDEKTSFLRRKIKKYYPAVKFNRSLLIKTLFDSHNKQISISDKKSFINSAINKVHPIFLDFYKAGWFAEAICLVKYKNKLTNVSILLQMNTDTDLASKWMIYQIHSKTIDNYNKEITVHENKTPKKFLSPMCHATNFTCLNNAFEDISYTNDYLESAFFKDPESVSFYHALQSKEIDFQYVKSVRYHFYQVNGWDFTVDKFSRNNSFNSGWLISNLKRQNENLAKSSKTLY